MIQIRKYQKGDAPQIQALILDNLKWVNSKDYGPDIINHMTRYFTLDHIRDLANKRHMYVAYEDQIIVGTASIEGDVVYTVFVDRHHHGQGIGKRLMERLEEAAVTAGLSHLNVPASLTAVGFYKHLGYVKVGESHSEQTGDVDIMTKSLITIKEPELEDQSLINKHFSVVIQDAFEKNQVTGFDNLKVEEIEDKKKRLQTYFDVPEEQMILLAYLGRQPVGTIGYSIASTDIVKGSNGALADVIEVGTVYIHPDYQGQGIGKALFKSLLEKMSQKGIEVFCFDSGYKIAQGVWQHIFGKPRYHLVDYWAENADHMIWYLTVEEGIRQVSACY